MAFGGAAILSKTDIGVQDMQIILGVLSGWQSFSLMITRHPGKESSFGAAEKTTLTNTHTEKENYN